MRHRVAGKQLSRTTSHRTALRRNMAASLFQHGSIRTTEVKAKELRAFVEKLITLAKKNTLAARREVIKRLQDREQHFVRNGGRNPDVDVEVAEETVVQKLFSEIAPKYADRPGGYTRIIRIAERRIGDSGEQVILQLVEEDASRKASGGSSRRKNKAAKLYEIAKASVKGAAPVEDEAPEEEASEEAVADEKAEEAAEEAAASEEAEAAEEATETEEAAEAEEEKAE